MQPIIHKAAIALDIERVPTGISPGDRASLSLDEDSTISVFVERHSRLPFGVGKPRFVYLGTLGRRATEILRPAIERAAHLRVRVIEVEPAHLSPAGRASVFVSVWGNPTDVLDTE